MHAHFSFWHFAIRTRFIVNILKLKSSLFSVVYKVMVLLTTDVILKSMKYGIICHIKTKCTPFLQKKNYSASKYKREYIIFIKHYPLGNGIWNFLQWWLFENLGLFSTETKGLDFVKERWLPSQAEDPHTTINYSPGQKTAWLLWGVWWQINTMKMPWVH